MCSAYQPEHQGWAYSSSEVKARWKFGRRWSCVLLVLVDKITFEFSLSIRNKILTATDWAVKSWPVCLVRCFSLTVGGSFLTIGARKLEDWYITDIGSGTSTQFARQNHCAIRHTCGYSDPSGWGGPARVTTMAGTGEEAMRRMKYDLDMITMIQSSVTKGQWTAWAKGPTQTCGWGH